MIRLLMTAALFLPAQATDAPDPARPDPARVERALTELEQAFKDGEAEDRARAISACRDLPDAEIVKWVEKGLRRKETEVRDAAIETLRFLEHPDALKALESTCRRDKKLRKEPEAFAALLRAIGQHGNPSSIEILLTDDVWAVQDRNVVRARLYALGHIRDERSVHALMGEMKSAGRVRLQPFMNDFQLALMVLTGDDQGQSQDLWMKWWNENKKKLEISPEEPEAAQALRRAVERLLGSPAHGRASAQARRPRTGLDRMGGAVCLRPWVTVLRVPVWACDRTRPAPAWR